jgi:hypothetical protein
MEQAKPRSTWKGIVIAVLALALLVLLLWLFLRPAEPARDVVFGDLGRRSLASNAVTDTRTRMAPVAPGDLVSNGGQMAANAPLSHEPGHVQNDDSAARMGSAPLAAQPGPGTVSGESNSSLPGKGSPEHSNSISNSPSSNQPPPSPPAPATRASALSTRPRPAFFEDNSPPPEPTNKDSTVALLAAAREAGRGPDNPIPARTADLLGNEGALARMFDAEAGSNVVFMLANSLSMMTNGKSSSARQAVARTLESMNASQMFYVLLFHSGGFEGMPSLGPVPATPENVRAMTNWLFNVGHRTGADPTKAVQRALGLSPAPDTVWLLSDSEIPNQVVDNIREANESVNAHINTIGFYTRAGEQGLRLVADENRGAYRFIPPPNAPSP